MSEVRREYGTAIYLLQARQEDTGGQCRDFAMGCRELRGDVLEHALEVFTSHAGVSEGID